MLGGSLFWIILFILLSLVTIIAVPRSKILKILPFSLVSGFILSFVLMYLYVNIFRWWEFNYPGVISLAGVPLFASLSWTPAVIIYSHFLSWPKGKWLFYGYIAGAALATALFVQWLVLVNYVEFIRWNFFYTIVMALVLFSVLNYYLAKVNLLKGEEVVS